MGIASGALVDLRDVKDFTGLVATDDGGLRIAAGTRLASLAAEPRMQEGYPGLAAAAGGLATPQIRAVATLGGSLMQRVRCWYYRNPDTLCLKKGGSMCFARNGDHAFHSCFDQGACIAPHPSTMGMALLAYEARIELHDGSTKTMKEFFGDGGDPTRENTLKAGDVIAAVRLPAPLSAEKAAYFRTIHRARAEWPLVEILVSLGMSGGRVRKARVAAGGVANTPLRLTSVERALEGKSVNPSALEAAAARAADGADPLPMTEYKVKLMAPTVLETLERAVEGGA